MLLDRDGIINELVYYPEHGIIDSPFTPEQFRLIPSVGPVLKRLKELEYQVIVVSNQPGVAKGHFDVETFDQIRLRMHEGPAGMGVKLDGEFYCMHHPYAKRHEYLLNCECRKPKPRLLIQAGRERNLSLKDSFMIGDGLVGVKSGKVAGCKTMLVGSMNSLLSRLAAEQQAEPDFLVPTLSEAVAIVEYTAKLPLGQTEVHEEI